MGKKCIWNDRGTLALRDSEKKQHGDATRKAIKYRECMKKEGCFNVNSVKEL